MPQDCLEVSKVKERLSPQDLMGVKVVDRKRCSTCKLTKNISEFYQKSNGSYSQCKECIRNLKRLRYKERPEYFRELTRKDRIKNPWRDELHNMKKSAVLAGVTIEQFKKIKEEHSGLCDICKRPETNGRRISVDHNHITNKFRGFLCNKCNRGLGYFGDKIEFLLGAIKYLKGE